jgi:hypothetical protein
MTNSIPFSFNSPTVMPVDEKAPDLPVPSQADDSSEYLCGNSGAEHSYANAGRDQDRSRADEHIPAQGCSRYVS